MNKNKIAIEQDLVLEDISGYNEVDQFDLDAMESILNQDIEEIISELDSLGKEKEKLTNPDALGKEIYNSIFNQLNAQNGMDLSSDTRVEKYQKGHVGETSSSAGIDALRDKNYQKVKNYNTQASKSKQGIKDAYTGKILRTSDGHQINTDHVVSRNEIYGSGIKKRLRELSGNETKDLANLPDNLVATNESLNKSKGAKSIFEYLKYFDQRRRDLIEHNKKKIDKINKSNISQKDKEKKIQQINTRQKDILDANAERMKSIDKKARKGINQKVYRDAAKNVAADAANAALRGALMTSAATLIKNIIDRLVEFFKSKIKSWSEFLNKMKQAISDFFNSLKSVFKNSMSGAIGSIVNNIANLISTKLTKVWSALKTGFSTIKNAMQVFKNPENKDKPFSVLLAEFGKVIAAGLAISGTLLLSEFLTKILLKAFPGLEALTIPIIGSIPGFIIEIILAIIGGIITGIAINFLNKFISGYEKSSLDKKLILKQNEVLDKQRTQIAILKQSENIHKKKSFNEIDSRHKQANNLTQKSLDEIFSEDIENYSFDDIQSDLETLL